MELILWLVNVKLKVLTHAEDLVVMILTVYLPGAHLFTLYLGYVLYDVKPLVFFLLNVPVNTSSSH